MVREFGTPSNQSDVKLGKTTKKAAAKAASKAVSKASEHAAEKAGDKIIALFHKRKTRPVQSIPSLSPTVPSDQPMSDYEINEQVNHILSGGKLRRVRFM